MHLINTKFEGVKLLTPAVYHDDRGFFLEAWHSERYKLALGIQNSFVQHNHSYSNFAVLRGLHYQRQHVQGKLIRVVHGKIWDVIVDLRRNSPTYGQWLGNTLVGIDNISTNHNMQYNQLWVPPGMAHGFVVLSEGAYIEYLCTDFYKPEYEVCLHWNDNSLNINWPIKPESISEKDNSGKSIFEIEQQGLLPVLF